LLVARSANHQSQIVNHQWFQPCRCLWRVFLQITRTTFLRFTMRQDSQSLLTEARTFMVLKSGFVFEGQKIALGKPSAITAVSLLLPEGNTSFGQIVGGHL
jgi:hypothetical protein